MLALAAFAVLGTGGLPAAAAAREQPPPRRPLLVADARALSNDEQLLFAALEGIVNRASARVYLEGLGNDQTAETWLRDAVPLPTKRVEPYDLLARFRSKVEGLVIWDPALAVDTQNVATTIAGLDDLLPVSPDLAATLTQDPYRLPVALDLRTLRFQSRSEAYEWALENLGPPSRFTHLAWLGPRGGPEGQHGLRDFVVARRGFAFEADPQSEADLVERILDAFPVGTRVYGYLFYAERVYTTTGLPVNEPLAVGEISRSGKVLIPSDVSTNLTVHSRFPPVAQSPPWDDQPRAVDAGKTYVAFLISDGDNLGYNQQALRTRHWDDPARGSIPIGVSISPFLATHAPRIYDYYVRTMAPNEVLVMGPSGAGYIYPQYHPDIGGYLAETCRLIDLTGLPAVWILDNGYAASPTPLITDRYVEALAPSAIFADYFGALTPNPPPVYFQRGVPVVHALFGLDVPTTVERVRLAAASFPGRPAFVLVALNTWSMGYSQAAEVMRQLGPSYEVARPDHFVGLLKTAYGEKGSAASQRSCEPNPGPCANERFGTVGPDHLRGTIAGDLTRGRDGDDAIEGRGGADCLFGNRDDDALRGGRGDDRLNGGGGHDSLNGGRGKDRVVGRRGDDRLAGNAGGDKIRAGRGDDRIDAAGGGHDIVSCGQGRDRVRADAGDSLAGCEDVERSRARRAQLARETNSPMMAP